MTNVKFLIEKDNNPDFEPSVFAFFPDDKYSHTDNGLFNSYAHLGQHSACHIDYANECTESKKEEYAALLNELIQVGYDDLNVLNKA